MASKYLTESSGHQLFGEDPNDEEYEEECNRFLQNHRESLFQIGEISDIAPLINSTDSVCDEGPSSCVQCTEISPIKKGHDFVKGMHIQFGRYCPSEKVNAIISKVVSKFTKDAEQPFVYFHHAIVTEVLETNDFTAKVKLVEFQSLGNFTFAVTEEEKLLNLKEEQIFCKMYHRSKFTPNEIVARARKCVGEEAYKLLSNNCEHIAVSCITGESESFQASNFIDKKLRQCLTTVMSAAASFLKIIMKKFSLFGKILNFGRYLFASVILTSVFFVIELVFTIFRLVQLKNQKDKSLICTKCYGKRKVYLIAKVMSCIAGTIAMLAINPTQKVVFLAAGIGIGLATAFALPTILTFGFEKIKTLINPLHGASKLQIMHATSIQPGDILTIPSDHDIIVRTTETLPRYQPSKYLYLDIVHYGTNGVTDDRTVVKERFKLKIEDDFLEVKDYPSLHVLEDKEVVEQALLKLGEQKFNIINNRSSHMCRKCKLKKEYRSSESKKRKVYSESDVKPGDVVNFKYFKLTHAGIVVAKHRPGDLIQLQYYHVDDGTVKLDKKRIDLDEDEVYLHNLTQIQREVILEKADSFVGKDVHKGKPYKSARYVKDCMSE